MRTTRFALAVMALLLCAAVAVQAASLVTGTLSAKGEGSPRLYMTVGTIQITGNGTLMVSGNAKVTFTTPEKYPMKPKPGKLAGRDMLAYNGFNGTAVVTGEHFSAGMYGKNITVQAKGAGYAILFGTGTYVVANDADPNPIANGEWTLASWMPGGKQGGDLNDIKIMFGQPDPADDPAPPKTTTH